MEKSKRYGIWYIHNIDFKDEFRTTVHFRGQEIELLITDYEGSKKLGQPFQFWIHEHLVGRGMMQLHSGGALPVQCIFVITVTPYEYDYDFIYWLEWSLRLVYHPPTQVSHVGEYIPNGAIAAPTWDNIQSVTTVSKHELNVESFSKVIEYFNTLSQCDISNTRHLEDIYQISNFNNVLLELLSLWAFIEGFWNMSAESSSNVESSFRNMLREDYAPQPEQKSIRQSIARKIEIQNGKIRKSSINDLRHVLAHGMFLKHEREWTKEQWQTIYDQRNLLFPVVIHSLINYLKRTHDLLGNA